MKPLRLQSKVFIKNSPPVIFLILIFLSLISCIFSFPEKNLGLYKDSTHNARYTLKKEVLSHESLLLRLGEKPFEEMPAQIFRTTCLQNGLLSLSITIKDNLESNKFILSHHKVNDKRPFTQIYLEKNKQDSFFEAYSTTSFSKGLKEELCFLDKSSKNILSSHKKELKDFVLDQLNLLSPQCFWTLNKSQWICETKIPAFFIRKEEKILRSLSQKMIRLWKRQPYIFARKLWLTKKLLELSFQGVSKDLTKDQLCKILKHSPDYEKPVILNNSRWVHKVCYGGKSDFDLKKEMLLAYSLAKKEILFLHTLISKDTKLGLLSFKLPKSKLKDKTILVKIKAQKSVYDYMIKTIEAFQKKSLNDLQSCWHPLFAADLSLLSKASLFDLFSTNNFKKKCNIDNSLKNHHLNLAQNIIHEIIGENTFLVSNGYSKLLRLPKGEYDYEILEKDFTKNQNLTLSRKKLGEGHFSWIKNKNYKTLRKM